MSSRRAFLTAGLAAISLGSLPATAREAIRRQLANARRGTGGAAGDEPSADAAPAVGDGGGGVYALQASLRFDQLRSVAYDPAKGTLTLLGDRFSDQWLVPIPYLDHLATALECSHPTFTLAWDDEATRQVDALIEQGRSNNAQFWATLTDNARARLFSPQNRLTKEGLRILQTLNFPTDNYEPFLTNKFDVIGRTIEVCGGEQQALLISAYGRSLRDPSELDAALEELAMARALDSRMVGPENADLWQIFLERFAGVFEIDPAAAVALFQRKLKQGEHLVLARNAAVEQLIQAIEPTWARVFPESLELSAEHASHIHLPPDLVETLANLVIRVRPAWERIAPQSQLAELMLDADLLLKWVVSDPALLGKEVTRHRTEYAWNHEHGDTASRATADSVRFWLSPDVLELAESADRGMLEFGQCTMRVNTDDPASQAYADYLTEIYDELAVAFPTLHELREATKLMAAAEWLKQRAPGLRLPAEGRGTWTPPAEVYGFVTLDATVRVVREDTDTQTTIQGKWTSQVHFEGGVSLALGSATQPDGNVLFDGARGPRYTLGRVRLIEPSAGGAVPLDDLNRVVVPEVYDNTTLRNVLRQQTIPPPPLPPGATARATLGRRKLDYLQVLERRLGERRSADAIQQDMQQAIRLARRLEFDDAMLNSLQAGRIDALQALQQAETWARQEREQFIVDLIDIASGGLSTWLGEQERLTVKLAEAEVLRADRRGLSEWLLLGQDYLPKIKGVLADLNTAQQSVRSREHFDRNLAYLTRSVELLGELNKALEWVAKEGWAKRMPGYLSFVVDAGKAALKLLDIQDNLDKVERLSTQAGEEAQFVQRLQDRRAANFRALQQIIERLEQASAG